MNINEEWFNSTSREEEGQILNKYITQIEQANFEFIDISAVNIRTNVLDSSKNTTDYLIVDTEATITNLIVTNTLNINDLNTGDICGNDASFNNLDIRDI
tara:strand:+ start:559 stop:858 length:300 start_codon:yes stop_codon:yes gene_type:complete